MPLVRRGECSRCGLCCRDPDRDTERATGLRQVVAGFCVYFRWVLEPGTGRQLGACTGRESAFYLAGCNVAPSYPSQFAHVPECTFTWEEVAVGAG